MSSAGNALERGRWKVENREKKRRLKKTFFITSHLIV